MTDSLYLEDLRVGQRFTSREFVIDAASIKAFAADYDPQPFHLDEVAAEESFFKGLAASGWQVAVMTMRTLVDDGPRISGGLIGAGTELSWPRPTRPGDRLTVFSEITEIRPSRSKPDRGIVILKSETQNDREEAVQLLTSKLLVFRRPQRTS
ncbi:MaoC family dehydratase [Rhizobium halophytocola]|uniref:Acyl dehydratase n=1 Tax=Rhizobium halophytocola TaxID=735519 RepID=A0ABS4DUA2_9HYPH|nr:MaoC family dehydratase [Rhizobium halophytocola]MBP1849284.1 acyl dehydratase [Rhizobium halophytocola]